MKIKVELELEVLSEVGCLYEPTGEYRIPGKKEMYLDQAASGVLNVWDRHGPIGGAKIIMREKPSTDSQIDRLVKKACEGETK